MAAENPASTRNDMVKFWKEYSKNATVEEVMLDFDAMKTEESERLEVLSLLPELSGMKVLELGAGIGRYTGELAQIADHVTAVDFMESFTNKNRETNAHLGNVDFMTADVTTLELPSNSFDFIFSNWLMMYLSDEEVSKLAVKMLSWLKDDGLLFYRESIIPEIAYDVNFVAFNPTVYRTGADYNDIFQAAVFSDDISVKKVFGYDLIFNSVIQTWIQMKNNRGNQYCWLLQKKRRSDTEAFQGKETYVNCRDNCHYTRNDILHMERILGDGFVSSGGLKTTKDFVAMLNLKPGQKVLDIGCGIGGGDFYMTKQYGSEILGIDVSSNMIEIARKRVTGHQDIKVQFEMVDLTKRSYRPHTFDVIYSRDTIKHIKNKPALFAKLLTWLKPGGKLLITDYCCGEVPHTEAFQKHVDREGYTLCTHQQYGKLIAEAGFTNVKTEDRSSQLKEILTEEKKRLEDIKLAFVQEFSEEDYQRCSDEWSRKLDDLQSGNHMWVLVYAEKKLN